MSISMIVSVDARFINYRCPANFNFRTTYMRRRTQLLRKYAVHHQVAESEQQLQDAQNITRNSQDFLQNYIDMRRKILSKKYGACTGRSLGNNSTASFDGRYSRSESLSSSFNPPPAALEEKLPYAPNESADFQLPASGHPNSPTVPRKMHSISLHDKPDKSVRAVVMCRTGTKFACCCANDNSITIVSLPKCNILLTLHGHQQPVTDVHWLPHADHWLVSCSYDASIRLWDCSPSGNGHCMRVCRDTSNSPILCFAAFPLNGNIVLSCNANSQLSMLNFSTGRFYSKSRSKLSSSTVNTMLFDDIGRFLLTGDKKGVLSLFRLENIATGKLALAKQYRMVHASITSLSFTTTKTNGDIVDRLILCSLAANVVLLLKLNTDSGGGSLVLYREFRGAVLHRQLAVKSCFSFGASPGIVQQNALVAVSGSEDGRVHIFNTGKHNNVEFQAHNCPVLAVACFAGDSSNDSLIIVSGDQSGQIAVWRYVNTVQ